MKGLDKFIGADTKAPNQIKALYKRPTKDKGVNMPHFQPIEAGQIVQGDLLFLPNDDGYRYALVVVDNGSRKCDAEPVRNKDNVTITNAFKAIFKRGIVKMPQYQVQVDSGTEFAGSTKQYFLNHGVIVKVAGTGRHRQVSLVEAKNKIIGSALHKRMASQELLTGQVSREWVADLPELIKIINDHIEETTKVNEAKLEKHPLKDDPVCKGDSCTLLTEGDKVRVQLDEPKDVADGKKLHGKFRASDIRWDPKIRTLKEVILRPNMSPLYLLDGPVSKNKITPIGYTKNQLLPVHENEELPNPDIIRGKPKQYIVEKLLEKKKIDNKIHFLVKWRGFDQKDSTWEPRTNLILEVPELVNSFK